ncbi:MAG: hypothetical protein Q4Q20_04790 [Methanocorpusculum sp.]|nr:hypothetical protein [Methanocorpusculum sp.]
MKRDAAVSEAVSFIFVLAAVLILVSLFLACGIPYLGEKEEETELDAVLLQFSSMQEGMDELVLTEAYGVQRDILLPVKKGTVILNLAADTAGSPFTLSYESPSGKTVTLKSDGLFRNGQKIQSFASYPLADAALSREGVSEGKTAVVSVTLLRTVGPAAGPCGVFSVRLV